MPKKQKDSSRASTRRKPWVDPDDAPEITDELLDRAVLRHGDSIFRRDPPAHRAQAAEDIAVLPV
jgi:hypothetical protein